MGPIVNKYPYLIVEAEEIEDVRVAKKTPIIVWELVSKISKQYSLHALTRNEYIRAYRDFMWRLGIDPTKERPSCEALIRRILSGRGLPRINNVVDIMNAFSAYYCVVMSVFDLDHISLPATLRAAEPGEKIIVIGGKEIELPEGFPILVDSKGLIFSATIYRDSIHTMVTSATKNILLVGYAPKTIERAYLRRAIRETSEAIEEYCGNK